MTYAEAGRDAVGAVVRHDCHLFNFGFPLPFNSRLARGGSEKELAYADSMVDRLITTMEAVTRAVVDPAHAGHIPRGPVREEDRRIKRMASLARLWSEVKYNFVFLNQRPGLDWENKLEEYLPRVATAKTQGEYLRLLAEAAALLKDDHTSVGYIAPDDLPALIIQPVGGRPVVTAVGDSVQLRAAGIRPGWEVLAINGTPVDQILKRDIYPMVSASTKQNREAKAFPRLLAGKSGTTISVTFLDLQGKQKTVGVTRDLAAHPEAAVWRNRPRPLVEFRELPGGIAYVALNSFGTASVVEQFDQHFERILKSQGLIIDVRQNGGGNSENGYAVIARLISEATTQTSISRTRSYKPAVRAVGKPEGWYEIGPDRIEPRGARPYLDAVVVLIGADTMSAAEDFLVPLKLLKRAALIGSPTAGSTGQPLRVNLYGTTARICTKWDRFPDGTEFVGVGIQPDILVEPTRSDIAAGKDAVLERAVAFLYSGGKE